MKTRSILTTIVILALMTSTTLATVWQIDSSPGNDFADFTTLQAAQDDASVVAGDTLYVLGSAVSYGYLTLTKKLYIIGPGYFLGKNPNTQANKAPALTSDITINAGSEESLLIGLKIEGDVDVNTSNITIKRCWISDNYAVITTASSIANIAIQQNYIRCTGSNTAISIGSTNSNIFISNNYIANTIDPSYYACIASPSTSSIYVQNNVLSGNVSISISTMQNNILREGSLSASNKCLFNSGKLQKPLTLLLFYCPVLLI